MLRPGVTWLDPWIEVLARASKPGRGAGKTTGVTASLGQGLERQTSRAALGPDPRLWRQTKSPFCAALRGALVNNKGKYKRRAGEAEPRIPSSTGNHGEKRPLGIVAMQNGQEISTRNKRTGRFAPIRSSTAHCYSLQTPADSDDADACERTEMGRAPGNGGREARDRSVRAQVHERGAGRNQKPFA